jgi:hypothetical protein
MIEFILDNLGIVFFVGIAIAARVLQARAKAHKREEAPPPVFAAALEPDDDDDDDEARYRLEPDEDESFINYSRTRGASAHAVEKARILLEKAPPRFTDMAEKPVDISSAAAPAGEAPAGPPPSNAVPEAPKKPASVLGPKKRTPLQEAVLWAEILGKPRGMV